MGLITSTGDFPWGHFWGALSVKLKKSSGKNLPALLILLFAFFLASPNLYSQGTGPCDGSMRWTGGAHWNPDGSINDAPNAPAPNGIIRCGSSAETQSNILPYNNTVYTPGVFEIDVESTGGCVDPSTGILAQPKNPTPGEPVIWINFDVRAYAGSFDIQINDNAGDNIGWALYVSNTHTSGVGNNGLSGDCSNLQLIPVSCGVESSNTFNSIPIAGVDFLESTNFYLAIWDQDADKELSINNFKARYGCGEPDLCSLSVGDPEVSCVVDGTYSVTVPIDGVNAQYSAIDPNALTISPDVCLGNIGEGGAISGSFVLTYNEGTNYNINIVASGEPTLVCTDPFNPTQCTGNVQGTSPVTTVVTADDDSVCVGSTVQLSGTPSGGTWSGNYVSASGLFDAAGLAAGPYEVTYTFTDNAGCSFDDIATVTVVSSPEADELDDVTVCDSYTLPTLSAGNQYWTATGGTGTQLFAGAVITTDQTIYIYAPATAPCIADQSEFDVIINDSPEADELDDVTVCDSYTLPTLSAGNQYWTATGGTGTQLFAGAVITTDQTIYIYAPATAPCIADQSEFDVIINDSPEADELDDVTVCDSYTLPTLSAGNQYWTATGGTGTQLFAGAVITTDQTIYIYAPATAPCIADQSEFDVIINDSPEADELDDVTVCDSYTLPTLSAGNQYWTATGGTGTQLFAGAVITTDQTIYIYAPATAPCIADQSEFDVIINDSPEADELDDVTVCDSYTLPTLSAGNQYWTATGGTGTQLFAGAVITTDQTIYIYAPATAPCIADQSEFDVIINDSPEADELDDVTVCDSYTLPTLSAGNQYWTATGGTGTQLFAGAVITTDQTIYIYAPATAPCIADQSEFDVIINDSPEADELDDVTVCDSYTLPTLSAGNQYWTATGGTGTQLFAGAVITTDQTIYIYAPATAPCIADQSEFDVIINDSPEADELDDVTVCDSYTLPTLSAGNQYWTATGGTGTQLFAGAVITTDQTIYIYAPATAPCIADQSEFDVIINDSPEADELDDVTVCDSYTLPTLSAGNQYWTATGGTGTQLFAGAVITTDQTIYIYAPATAPCIADQSEFDVIINDSPEADELDDVTVCDSYTLPTLSAGNQYWTATGGTGTQLFAGAVITTDQTIYIYAPATAPCIADQSEFDVIINDSPEADELDDVTVCDSYTLPTLSAGNQYWTATGGTGTQLFAGAVITTDQTIYIYAPATAPCIADQSEFDVIINDSPEADELDDVTVCDSYTLPTLSAGNQYWTATGGTGTQLFAGAVITTDQTIYIYAPATAPCIADQSEFDVIINDSPEADELDDVTVCDSYTLPTLSAGNQYWTATGGTGTQLFAGAVITTDQTIYIYAPATAPCIADQSEFDVIINDSPEADELDDVTVCDSYTLPTLSAGNQYWTATGGTGTQLFAGAVITTDQTIYIYAPATAPCIADQSEFDVIINDSPEADELDDVTVCDSYTLPTLSAGNQYWTATGGTGTQLFAGAVITTDQTIYIYAPATAPCIADQSEFDVIINDSPEADELDDVTVCDSYTLPTLSAGNQYWTATGGTGTQLFAGAVITTDQTIYIYAPATAPCIADQSEFDVIINDSAQIPEYQITQADCLGGNGALAFVNPGNGNDLYYSINGGNFILYTEEIPLALNDYEFIVKYGIDGCPSEEFIITIGRPQEVTVTLLYEVEQPECESLVGTIFILNEEILHYTVKNTATNVIHYDNVAYPNTGFINLPPGEYLITGVSANGCISGSVLVTLTEPDCQVAEGCTLGYWKNHTDRWCNEYQTCTLYGEVFEDAPEELKDLTLLEVLNLGGGGINNLGRQSVAALLNTCSEEVDYYYTDQMELIDYVNSNFTRSLAGAAGTYLDELNNAGCPLGGTQATSEPSEGCETDTPDGGNNGDNGIPGKGNGSVAISGFSAYPVPFKETLNIQYEFDYVSPATIQFFDMRGRLLRSIKELKATRGVVTTIDIGYSMRPSQTYIVKVTTDREVITKQIVSSK